MGDHTFLVQIVLLIYEFKLHGNYWDQLNRYSRKRSVMTSKLDIYRVFAIVFKL